MRHNSPLVSRVGSPGRDTPCTTPPPAPPRSGADTSSGRNGARAAGPDDRPIDAPQVAVDPAAVVQFVEQRGGDPDPWAIAAPAMEAAEDRRPGPLALGEVAPRRAGMQDPEDAVDDRPVIGRRP